MRFAPTRLYAWVASVGLILQGTTTLAARLIPSVDRAFPALMQQTHMVPAHSLLHILSALAGFLSLRAARGPFRFALGFGVFYVALAVAGATSGHQMGIGLQPFDHSFHLVLGGAGVVAAGLEFLWNRMTGKRE